MAWKESTWLNVNNRLFPCFLAPQTPSPVHLHGCYLGARYSDQHIPGGHAVPGPWPRRVRGKCGLRGMRRSAYLSGEGKKRRWRITTTTCLLVLDGPPLLGSALCRLHGPHVGMEGRGWEGKAGCGFHVTVRNIGRLSGGGIGRSVLQAGKGLARRGTAQRYLPTGRDSDHCPHVPMPLHQGDHHGCRADVAPGVQIPGGGQKVVIRKGANDEDERRVISKTEREGDGE